METVWKPVVTQVYKKVTDIQKIADQKENQFKIAPWDYRYLWVDVISADSFQAFTEANGSYDKVVAKRLLNIFFL